jgi:endonuclease/exonuclease/phosphatase family metal-dependent hydrolase
MRTPQVRIATWNVNRARPSNGARSSRVRGALAAIDADLLVLTECHPEFLEGTGYEPLAASSEASDATDGCRWVMIYGRRSDPSQTTPIEPTGEPDRSAAVMVTIPGFPRLILFGTVLPWRSDTRFDHLRGANAFQHALRAQAADWRTAAASHSDAELCVAGDFNQELDSNGPVGTRIGRETLRTVVADLKLVPSCGAADPLEPYGVRSIDHILVSPGLAGRCRETNVWPEGALQRNVSDHHGVVLSLA